MPFATAHGWDVREAIRAHVLGSPYPILPVDVARKWRAYRRDRLDRHTDPTPVADPDDPAAWRTELLGTRHAVATGMAAPSPHRQLTGGPHRDLDARLAAVGSSTPPAVRAALAPYRPAHAAREAVVAAGQPDALSVPCRWCHADKGEPCRTSAWDSTVTPGATHPARGRTPPAWTSPWWNWPSRTPCDPRLPCRRLSNGPSTAPQSHLHRPSAAPMPCPDGFLGDLSPCPPRPTLEISDLPSPTPIPPAASPNTDSHRSRIARLRARYRHRADVHAGGHRANRGARFTLVVGLMAVVLMAFRVSWNALSDVARAIGADSTAALLYPIVVDGLMALALTATLVLPDADRKFALRVLATYTIASLLLNYVHGLTPALHTMPTRWGRLTDWDPANWALVLLATSLPVGSIYFGSDLVAKVLHHHPESADSAEAVGQQADEQDARSTSDQHQSAPEQPTESAPAKAAKTPVPRPAEATQVARSTRPPRSTAAVESTGAAPSRATGRATATAESASDRPRTDAEVLAEARLLTADWSADRLTAQRLRSELRISQTRARTLRNQLKAERTDRPDPVAYDDIEAEPPRDGPHEAASEHQRHLGTAAVGTT